MPIQLHNLDDLDYWSEDVKPTVIDDLEFYCGSPVAPRPTSSSVMTVPAAVSTTAGVATPPTASADLWKTFEMDEDSFAPMSPPDPSGFDEISFVDFEEADITADPLISADPLMSASIFDNEVLFHDCMWAGPCAGNDQETRTLSRQSSTSSSDSVNSCSRGGGSTSSISISSSSSSKTNDQVSADSNRTTAGSSSSNSSNTSNLNNGCINRTGKTIPQLQNVVNSNSNSSSSSHVTVSGTSTSVVKTIEVPTVSGGPVRKTGVIVQKTFGRSLLIKSRTKCENNNASLISANSSNSSSSSSGNSLLKVRAANPISHVTLSSSNNSSNSNNVITNNNTNSVQTAPAPVVQTVAPFVSVPPVVSNSRPETPQSLSESEDDSCQLDLNSVLYNLDNLKPPQGDLWDEVLAAVEQEQANGIEIPPAPISCTVPFDVKSEITPAPLRCNIPFDLKSEPELKEEVDEDEEEDDLSDSSVQLESGPDDLPPSPATTNSSPVKTFPNAGKGLTRNAIAAVTTVVSDHSYDKRAWIRLEDLGVQTPSDSEEEVDVVSLYQKSGSGSSSRSSSRSSSASPSGGLPNNPSAKDQEEIQVITTSKLLSASRAVSKRLKTKISRGKTFSKSGKRRLSESDEYRRESMKLSKRARIHHYRPTKSRFATDSESDSKEKRDMHNNMERMRRIDLRNSFEELKALVPSLANKERAPKVLILQDAAGYCTDLKIQSRQLAVQVAALRKEQERLRATVSGLRRSLAAHR